MRAIVICPPRRSASVDSEWMRVVASRFVVVVARLVVVAVFEAAPPLSAAVPPTTAPPTSTAETRIDRPLIGPPIGLNLSPNRRLGFSLGSGAGTDDDTDQVVRWQRRWNGDAYTGSVVGPFGKYGGRFLRLDESEMRVRSSFEKATRQAPKDLLVGPLDGKRSVSSGEDRTSTGAPDRSRTCAHGFGGQCSIH